MPLAHGGTLHGVIQSRRAAMEARGVAHTACVGDEALFYVSETVAALRFLHGKGIVHRDLVSSYFHCDTVDGVGQLVRV